MKKGKIDFKSLINKAKSQFNFDIESIILVENAANNTLSFSKYGQNGRIWSKAMASYKKEMKVDSDPAQADILCIRKEKPGSRPMVLMAYLDKADTFQEFLNTIKGYGYGK